MRVYDFGQTDAGQLYLAMELLHGQELAKVLKEERTLEPMRAIRIAIAVLKSLAEAHDAGMVHRDLKPENVFLCRMRGEDDFVKLIDFGIAKSFEHADQDLTKTGFAVGTPKYMSPEQGRAEPLDGRSDLYSLGIILYQCLTSDVPFRAPSAMGIIVKHLQERPVPVDQAAPQPLPSGLADVVMRALAKRREDRFADADDMRLALEHVLEAAGESLTGRGRPHTTRGLPNVSTGSGATATRPPSSQSLTPENLRTPQALAAAQPNATPVEPRIRQNSGIGEFLATMGAGSPLHDSNGGQHNPIGWVPPAEPTVADSAQTPGSLRAGPPPPLSVPPAPVVYAAPPGQVRSAPPASQGKPQSQASQQHRPPSKTAGAWVFMLVMLIIVGGMAWWYWTQAQNDPEAMEKLKGVTALVDKGRAKLDELTGATDQEPAQPATDDAASKHKPGKAAKAKAEDAPKIPEITQESAESLTLGAVQKCYAKEGAKPRDFTHITIDVMVDDAGIIKRANLRKKFGTGATAGCVEKAVSQARMPAGQAGERTLEYDLPVPEDQYPR